MEKATEQMNAKDKVDALLKLAEMANSRHDARRNVEWKLAFGMWTAVFVATAFVVNTRLAYPGKTGNYVVIGSAGLFFLAAWLLYSLVWLRGLWEANKNDKNLSEHCWKEAFAIMQNPDHPVGAYPDKLCEEQARLGFRSDWAMRFHMGATGLLLLLALVFLGVILWPS